MGKKLPIWGWLNLSIVILCILLIGRETKVDAQTDQNLIISEIMYDPKSSEDDWEWVEIYNAGSTALNLSGFVIDDGNSLSHASPNIGSGAVPAGKSAILFNIDDVSAAEFREAWGDVDLIPVTGWSRMSLNNSFDDIAIWQSFTDYDGDHQTQANAVERVEYLSFVSGWPDPPSGGGLSIYLKSLTADNNVGSNWALSTVDGNTPVFASYQSQSAGGNSGNDIGSPGLPPAPPPTVTPTSTQTPTSTATETATSSPTTTSTMTATSTATETATSSPTLTPTETATPSTTPSQTPLPTSSPTQTATSPPPTTTPTDTATETATNSPTLTPTETTTPSATPSQTSMPTSSPTQTATNTQTPTTIATETSLMTPTSTATKMATTSPTKTIVPSATPSLTPSATSSPTQTPTTTPAATETATSSPTHIPIETAAPSATPSLPTPSPTQTATNTQIPTTTATFTPTETATSSPSATLTETITSSATPSQTATNTPTPTASATQLPSATTTIIPVETATIPPTNTSTAIPDNSPTATPASSNTPTLTPSPTHSATASATITQIPSPTSTATLIAPTAPTGTPQPISGGQTTNLFLPLMNLNFSQPVQLPDLVISSISLTQAGVEIIIENIGDGPAGDPFWIDLFVNPTQEPKLPNDTLEWLLESGYVWGVDEESLPLLPQQKLVLTIKDQYFSETYSNFQGELRPGDRLIGHVDSAHTNTTFGAVFESHESNNETYNNIKSEVLK